MYTESCAACPVRPRPATDRPETASPLENRVLQRADVVGEDPLVLVAGGGGGEVGS